MTIHDKDQIKANNIKVVPLSIMKKVDGKAKLCRVSLNKEEVGWRSKVNQYDFVIAQKGSISIAQEIYRFES